MKVRTVIERRLEVTPRKKSQNEIIIVAVIMLNMVFGTVLPFVVGFYYGFTKHILFFSLFILLMFMGIRFDYDKKGEFKIIFVRGL